MTVELIGDIRQSIGTTLQRAASATGAGFDYLFKTAVRESGLRPNAKASTSSAAGMFQFVEQTWLQTVKEDGAAFGLGHYANQITRSSSGNYQVTDAKTRQEILDLRYDAAISAKMAGAFTNKNDRILSDFLGRDATDGELYIAHFMGAQGAKKLLSVVQTQPNRRVDDLFPQAAAANKTIFYNQGKARSAQEVYAHLVKKHDQSAAPVAMAQAPSASSTTAGTPFWAQQNFAPQTTTALSYASENDAPVFHSMFSGERTAPVSDYVQKVWGGDNLHTQTAAAKPAETKDTRQGLGASQLSLQFFSMIGRNTGTSPLPTQPAKAL